MFDDREKNMIVQLAAQLTGGVQFGDSKQNAIVTNVERRMRELKIHSLKDYLSLAEKDTAEHGHLISALTIHTTSWFRENPHFVILQEILLESLEPLETFKVWSAACSTGEEAYSVALLLEEFRRNHPKFDYQILGTDIDPVSIGVASRGIYSEKQINFHLSRYQNHLLFGSERTQGLFTLSKEIRNRCRFRVHDLRSNDRLAEGPFHMVLCRNVLIYLSPSGVQQVVHHLASNVRSNGHLFVGHSESIQISDLGFSQRGHSVYKKTVQPQARSAAQPQSQSSPIRRRTILVIEKEARTKLSLEKDLSNLGFHPIFAEPKELGSKTFFEQNYDLILIPIIKKNGDHSLIKRIRERGIKTPIAIFEDSKAVNVSDVIETLSEGAQEYIDKGTLKTHPSRVKQSFLELILGGSNALQNAIGQSEKNVTQLKSVPIDRPELILVGASTGGPQALSRVFGRLPANCPPVLVTQHISARFARPLAERLARESGLELANLSESQVLRPGHLYMPFQDEHIGLKRDDKLIFVTRIDRPPVNSHRPSVDVMFESALDLPIHRMAILLTGMGKDGAANMLRLKQQGVFCVAQSESDCAVYGMPRAAIEMGAADFVGDLDEIRTLLLNSLKLVNKKAV